MGIYEDSVLFEKVLRKLLKLKDYLKEGWCWTIIFIKFSGQFAFFPSQLDWIQLICAWFWKTPLLLHKLGVKVAMIIQTDNVSNGTRDKDPLHRQLRVLFRGEWDKEMFIFIGQWSNSSKVRLTDFVVIIKTLTDYTRYQWTSLWIATL